MKDIIRTYLTNKIITNGNAYLFMKFTKTNLSKFNLFIFYCFYYPILYLYALPTNIVSLLLQNRKDKITGEFVVDVLRKDYR